MKLLNVGQREFVTKYGSWLPMGIIDVPDAEAEGLLAYGKEVKIVESAEPVAPVVEESQATVEAPSKKVKKAK